MKKYLISNAQAYYISGSTGVARPGELSSRGITQTRELRNLIPEVALETCVAISEDPFSKLTAEALGAAEAKEYRELNNPLQALTKSERRLWLKRDILAPDIQAAAENLLDNPLEEAVWFTNASIIAGITAALGFDEDDGYAKVPAFSELRVFDL